MALTCCTHVRPKPALLAEVAQVTRYVLRVVLYAHVLGDFVACAMHDAVLRAWYAPACSRALALLVIAYSAQVWFRRHTSA